MGFKLKKEALTKFIIYLLVNRKSDYFNRKQWSKSTNVTILKEKEGRNDYNERVFIQFLMKRTLSLY